MDKWFINENSEQLSDEILELLEQCAQDILDETGVKLKVSYREEYGFNIDGKRGTVNSYICNFDEDGYVSFYDAWEFGNEDERYLIDRISELICEISSDGQIHYR